MERETFLQYLKHLNGVIEALGARKDLCNEDLLSLAREILLFRQQAGSLNFLGPEIKRAFSSLDLRMDRKPPRTKWLPLFLAPFAIGTAFRLHNANRRAFVQEELDRIQAQVRELHYAAQV